MYIMKIEKGKTSNGYANYTIILLRVIATAMAVTLLLWLKLSI